jgi:hypothetical protein
MNIGAQVQEIIKTVARHDRSPRMVRLLMKVRLLEERGGNQSPKLVQTLLGHHSAAFTMDVYSDLWPTALDGIGERIAVTLFSGDGSKVLANEGPDSSDSELHEAQAIDMNGGPCRDRTYDQEIKSLLLYQLS